MSKEAVREAAILEQEFHRSLSKFHPVTDKISWDCCITDYLQKSVDLHNKHSKDFQLRLELIDDTGAKLEHPTTNYIQRQVDRCNKILQNFQLKLVIEGVVGPQIVV